MRFPKHILSILFSSWLLLASGALDFLTSAMGGKVVNPGLAYCSGLEQQENLNCDDPALKESQQCQGASGQNGQDQQDQDENNKKKKKKFKDTIIIHQ